jgi:hypothetical protein
MEGWASYGLVLMDWFIFLPNVASLLLSLVQLGCCIVFPSIHEVNEDKEETSADNINKLII